MHYEKFQDGTVKCIEDEIPFEVPEGWAWARLRDICMMSAGKSKSSDQIKSDPFQGSYPCFGGNGVRGYVDEYNQDGIFSIVGRQGALCGNINIAIGKFYATEHAVVTTLFAGIDFKWSNYILEALQLNNYATGAAQPGLSVANILNVFVPVPPTQEQDRIGNNVDKSLKFIEALEQEKIDLQKIIIAAKTKILDLAIRGKLVPQDPNDKPASVLLERIRAEKEELIKQGKIKRDRKESVIFKGDDNSYYEKYGEKLPSGWVVTNFETILEYEQPTKYIVHDTNYKPTYKTPVLTAGKSFILGYTNETDNIFDDLPVIIFDDFTTESKFVDFSFKVKSSAMKILHINQDLVLPKYAFYLMQATEIDHDNHQRYWISTYSQEIVALPPINEQERILTALEHYFNLLDTLQ